MRSLGLAAVTLGVTIALAAGLSSVRGDVVPEKHLSDLVGGAPGCDYPQPYEAPCQYCQPSGNFWRKCSDQLEHVCQYLEGTTYNGECTVNEPWCPGDMIYYFDEDCQEMEAPSAECPRKYRHDTIGSPFGPVTCPPIP